MCYQIICSVLLFCKAKEDKRKDKIEDEREREREREREYRIDENIQPNKIDLQTPKQRNKSQGNTPNLEFGF